jgi:hypothetical protein
LARERVPLYERADATIDTEAGAFTQVVDRVAELASTFLNGSAVTPPATDA